MALASSPLSLLWSHPRVLVYQIARIPEAVGVGAIVYANLLLATQLFSGREGVGVLALVFSLSCAIGASLGGPLADKLDARWLSGGALSVTGIALAAVAFSLAGASAETARAVLIAGKAIEGACVGLTWASNPVVQAALVPASRRGAMDLFGGLRTGLGVALGTQLGHWMPNAQILLMGSAAACLLSGVACIVVTRGLTVAPARRWSSLGWRPVLQALRDSAALRHSVVVDFLFKVAIPTQLAYLYLADPAVMDQAGIILGMAQVGVMAAGLWLGVMATPSQLSPVVRRYFAIYIGLAAVGFISFTDNWLSLHPWLAGAMLMVGSFASQVSESLVRSSVQQRSPDEVRGRLSGSLATLRSMLVAAVAASHSALAGWADINMLILAILLCSAVAWVLTRGLTILDPVSR